MNDTNMNTTETEDAETLSPEEMIERVNGIMDGDEKRIAELQQALTEARAEVERGNSALTKQTVHMMGMGEELLSLRDQLSTAHAKGEEMRAALGNLLSTVKAMRVPQTTADAALQLMQFEPVLIEAEQALTGTSEKPVGGWQARFKVGERVTGKWDGRDRVVTRASTGPGDQCGVCLVDNKWGTGSVFESELEPTATPASGVRAE